LYLETARPLGGEQHVFPQGKYALARQIKMKLV
jgi:hypothetical protein